MINFDTMDGRVDFSIDRSRILTGNLPPASLGPSYDSHGRSNVSDIARAGTPSAIGSLSHYQNRYLPQSLAIRSPNTNFTVMGSYMETNGPAADSLKSAMSDIPQYWGPSLSEGYARYVVNSNLCSPYVPYMLGTDSLFYTHAPVPTTQNQPAYHRIYDLHKEAFLNGVGSGSTHSGLYGTPIGHQQTSRQTLSQMLAPPGCLKAEKHDPVVSEKTKYSESSKRSATAEWNRQVRGGFPLSDTKYGKYSEKDSSRKHDHGKEQKKAYQTDFHKEMQSWTKDSNVESWNRCQHISKCEVSEALPDMKASEHVCIQTEASRLSNVGRLTNSADYDNKMVLKHAAIVNIPSPGQMCPAVISQNTPTMTLTPNTCHTVSTASPHHVGSVCSVFSSNRPVTSSFVAPDPENNKLLSSVHPSSTHSFSCGNLSQKTFQEGRRVSAAIYTPQKAASSDLSSSFHSPGRTKICDFKVKSEKTEHEHYSCRESYGPAVVDTCEQTVKMEKQLSPCISSRSKHERGKKSQQKLPDRHFGSQASIRHSNGSPTLEKRPKRESVDRGETSGPDSHVDDAKANNERLKLTEVVLPEMKHREHKCRGPQNGIASGNTRCRNQVTILDLSLPRKTAENVPSMSVPSSSVCPSAVVTSQQMPTPSLLSKVNPPPTHQPKSVSTKSNPSVACKDENKRHHREPRPPNQSLDRSVLHMQENKRENPESSMSNSPSSMSARSSNLTHKVLSRIQNSNNYTTSNKAKKGNFDITKGIARAGSAPPSSAVCKLADDGRACSAPDTTGTSSGKADDQAAMTGLGIPVGIAVATQRQELSRAHPEKQSLQDSTGHDSLPDRHLEQDQIKSEVQSERDILRQPKSSCLKQNTTTNGGQDMRTDLGSNLIITGNGSNPWPDESTLRHYGQWLQAGHPAFWLGQSPFGFPQGIPTSVAVDPNNLPMSPPAGYKLAHDSLTGQFFLLPSNLDVVDPSRVWLAAGTHAPTSYQHLVAQQQSSQVQQAVLQQERSQGLDFTLAMQQYQQQLEQQTVTLQTAALSQQTPQLHQHQELAKADERDASVLQQHGDQDDQEELQNLEKIPSPSASPTIAADQDGSVSKEKSIIVPSHSYIPDLSVTTGQLYSYSNTAAHLPFLYNPGLLPGSALPVTLPEAQVVKSEASLVQSRGTSPIMVTVDPTPSPAAVAVAGADDDEDDEKDSCIQTEQQQPLLGDDADVKIENTVESPPSPLPQAEQNLVQTKDWAEKEAEEVLIEDEVEAEADEVVDSVTSSKLPAEEFFGDSELEKASETVPDTCGEPVNVAETVDAAAKNQIEEDPDSDVKELAMAVMSMKNSDLARDAACDSVPYHRVNSGPGTAQSILCDSIIDSDALEAKGGLELLSTVAEQLGEVEKSPTKSCGDNFFTKSNIDRDLSKQQDAHMKMERSRSFITKQHSIRKDQSHMAFGGLRLFQDLESFLEIGLEGMDVIEVEMRMRLAELQRRYKEKQRELARLQLRKDREEENQSKKGPGRPRKRKSNRLENNGKNSRGGQTRPISKDPQAKRKKIAEKLVDKVFRQSALMPAAKKSKSGKTIIVSTKPGVLLKRPGSSFGARSSDVGRMKLSSEKSSPSKIKKGDALRYYSSNNCETDKFKAFGVNLLMSHTDSQKSVGLAKKKKRKFEDPLSVKHPENAYCNDLLHMKLEESDGEESDITGSGNKKRKPGRPKRCNPNKLGGGVTETIVAKKPKHLSLLHLKKHGVALQKQQQKNEDKFKFSSSVQLKPLYLDEEWCVRRSERIFLSDTSPQPSPNSARAAQNSLPTTTSSYIINTTISNNNNNTSSTTSTGKSLKRAHKTRSPGPKTKNIRQLSQKLKKKYSKTLKKVTSSFASDSSVFSDAALTHSYKEVYTDSDSEFSSEADNVPLSTLRERPQTPEPRSCIIEKEELKDGLRVLVFRDGLFYEGAVKAIRPPDVYGVVIDNERGNRPHIYSQEEILKEAVLDVRPGSQKYLPEGTRICAYWSQQYSCLYPGTVAKSSPNPHTDKNSVNVEFDDGDSGRIPMDHVRMLPEDFPQASYDQNPILLMGKRRRRTTSEEGDLRKPSFSDSVTLCGQSSENKKQKPKQLHTPKLSKGKDPEKFHLASVLNQKGGDGENVFGCALMGNRPSDFKNSLNNKNVNESYVKERFPHKKDFTTSGHSPFLPNQKNKDRKLKGTNQSEFPFPLSSASDGLLFLSNTENRKFTPSCKTIKHNPGHNCSSPLIRAASFDYKSELNIPAKAGMEVSVDEDFTGDEDSSDVQGKDVETDISMEEERRSERHLSVKTEKPCSKKAKISNGTKKKRSERNGSSENKSKIAAFLPARQLWRWSGKSTKRPGMKGKAKKEFYKAIVRGKETIMVGDCAVFLSTGRPHLPYVGRIESLWEGWGGNMVVKVKWFYHPEETKRGKHHLNLKGALFQSPHVDENDVQTISHKCELMSFVNYRHRKLDLHSKGGSIDDNEDVYYLAGSYDPITGRVTYEPGVI